MIQIQAVAECDGCGFRYQEMFDETVAAVRTVEAAGWRFHGGVTGSGEITPAVLLCNECEDQR
jgi:hypothetical protein